ncbi:MAG: metallophosphoesterase [Myxococcales bacterium]|nr:metallophosphoesterase [Myxococcales bacterium]
MATFRWLHFADLQVGRSDAPIVAEDVRSELERDLRALHSQCGPWDVVFLTGSLAADRRNPTSKGGSLPSVERNLGFLDSVLDSLWSYLQSLGSTPAVLALPGFGDMESSIGAESDPAQRWEPFGHWIQSWYSRHPLPPWITLQWGKVRADWRAVVFRDSARFGIAGLGSFVDKPEPPVVSDLPSLLQTIVGRPLPAWAGENDVNLLALSRPFRAKHAPKNAFSSALQGISAILCGQPATIPHERGFTAESMGLPTVLVPSMARLDGLGYTAGVIDVGETRPILHLWPRILTPSLRGMPVFVPSPEANSETGEQTIPLAARDEDDGLTVVAAPVSHLFRPQHDDSDDLSSAMSQVLGSGGAAPKPAASHTVSALENVHAPKAVAFKPTILKRLRGHAAKRAEPEKQPAPEAPISAPVGITPTRTLNLPTGVIWIAVSQNRNRLAALTGQTTVLVLEPHTGKKLSTVPLSNVIGQDIAFSPDNATLAVVTDRGLHIVVNNEVQNVITSDSPRCVCWESAQSLLVGFAGGRIDRYNAEGIEQPRPAYLPTQFSVGPAVSAIAYDPHHDRFIAAHSSFRSATVTRYQPATPNAVSLTLMAAVLDLTFSPDGMVAALTCDDGLVVIIDVDSWVIRNTLRAHWDAVSGVQFSPNGKLLVTKGLDDRVVLWDTTGWLQLAELAEPADRRMWSNAAFVDDTTLVTLRPNNQGLRFWSLNLSELLGGEKVVVSEAVSSAKVVLLGEGRSGKSCLALRLAENRYDSTIPSTHGMRIWRLKDTTQTDIVREIILWDLGGQHEYRLIHPLFLRHTSVALLVMEPGRGQPALTEVSAWDQMLCSRTDPNNKPIRFLVGTKLDDDFAPVERQQIDLFVNTNQYHRFFPTSAKTGFGCTELFQAIVSAIDWASFGHRTRATFEHVVQAEIDSLRKEGRVFVPFGEIEKRLQQEFPATFEASAIGAVVSELSLCGMVWDTRLGDGTRIVILDVERIEQYAGSLVVCARENPRGVPAIEIGLLSSPGFVLPRIKKEVRLPRDQELVILDITVQLILEQGLAFRTGGLLIFPSLFPSDESVRPPHPYTVPLYYEFSGAIDQVYATVVSSLANLRRFGAVRLYKNAAEFGLADGSVYGLSRQEKQNGNTALDRLDLYFSDTTQPQERTVFIQFVEEHLREVGVGVLERLDVRCECGYAFDEAVVRKRLEDKRPDMLCPQCETRTPLSLMEKGNGDRDQIRAQLVALRNEITESRREAVRDTKYDLQTQRLTAVVDQPQQPVRILHLSDLHIFADADPKTLLQPLAADLRDKIDGMGIESLDLLVLSGDITNYGTAAEFQQALLFVQELVKEFGLSSQRCMIVPGNHDLSWEHEVYDWKSARKVAIDKLTAGTFVRQGDGVLVRKELEYPGRFTHFSEHFYHPLFQQPYPLAPEDQGISAWFPQFKLQFLLLNTSVEIDEYHQSRSMVSPKALAKALSAADGQIKQADRSDLLRIAVFHHPITGNEKMEDDGFAEQLRKNDVRLALHGHVHEERHDLLAYLDPKRKMHCAGAGSFGAGAKERPPSVPRLYNLIEVAPDHKKVRIYTRSMRKDTGAWSGHAIWPGADPHTKRAWVDLEL